MGQRIGVETYILLEKWGPDGVQHLKNFMEFASGVLLPPQAQRCAVCVASYLV